AIGRVDAVLRIDGDAVDDVELVRTGAPGADRLQPMPAGRDLHHPRIAVAVGHEDVVVGIPGDAGGTLEGADAAVRIAPLLHVDRTFDPARLALIPAPLLLHHRLEPVDGFRGATELGDRDRLRVVLDEHARALIDLPDVVVPVHADRVREGRRIV